MVCFRRGFIKILEDNKALDMMEIMTHPAYVDYDILNNSGYNTQRAYELKTLTSIKVKEYIEKNNIELINYTNL